MLRMMRALCSFLLLAPLCCAQNLSSPQRLFNEGLAAQKRGDLPSAIPAYEQALKLSPHMFPARLNLATAFMKLGRLDQAIENYQIALRQSPGNVQVAVLLGNCLVLKGSYDDAITLLKPLEKARPDELNLGFILGEALVHAQKPEEGLRLLEKVAAARNDANAWMLAGMTELRLSEYSRAVRSLDKGLKLDSSVPGAYTLSGMAKSGAGDEPGAKAAFRRALEADQNDFDANLRLGAILRRQGDLEGARPYLARSLQLQPESLAGIYQMAQLEAAESHDTQAIAGLEKVVGVAPNILQPHVQLSGLYYRLHRPEDGKREREIVDHLLDHPEQQDHRLESDPSMGSDKSPLSGQAPSP
jgi:tetratricopeptide (TPR) repeat protein